MPKKTSAEDQRVSFTPGTQHLKMLRALSISLDISAGEVLRNLIAAEFARRNMRLEWFRNIKLDNNAGPDGTDPNFLEPDPNNPPPTPPELPHV